MSGGGKSTTMEALKTNILALNREDIDVISFDWEMPSVDQIARAICKHTEIIYEDLFDPSKQGDPQIADTFRYLASLPIYLCEIPGVVDEVYNTIMEFIRTRNLAARKRKLIVTLDHTLLTKGATSDSEKRVIDQLYQSFVTLKKVCETMDVPILIIILSQLNRDIERPERVTNPRLHYPTKNDIFAASSVYYCSDYVLISHKPNVVNGIGSHYGPPLGVEYPKGLPIYVPDGSDRPMVYWHVIKNRFGKVGIIPMVDHFEKSSIKQYEPNG